MKKEEYTHWQLLMRVLTGEWPEDHPDFVAWLEEDKKHIALYEDLKNGKTSEGISFDTGRMYKQIERQLFHRSKRRLYTHIGYAAAVALILCVLTVFYQYQAHDNQPALVEVMDVDSIVPGSKKAQLVLADGTKVGLDKSFELTSTTKITNDTVGRIVYFPQPPIEANKKPETHRIEVPLGGEYELKLGDGTQVYLNSGSSLTYPSFFEGDVREVILSGEAYFDVAKSDRKFSVITEDAVILVHGTSFNLCAYKEEEDVNATLVTGRIQMITKTDENSGDIHSLIPGQNLTFNKTSHKVQVENVDTELYTAWIRGEYIFRNQPLEEIFNKLSKWYNFSIAFDSPAMKQLRFTGSVEKKRPIEYLLNQIKQVTNLKFEQHGNMIQAYY